jgi:hypothetical protein
MYRATPHPRRSVDRDRRPCQDLERGLIAFAVVGGSGPLDAVEFDDYDALDESGFVCFHRGSASQKPPAGSRNRRTGELGITSQCLRVRNRTIRRHPIRLCHRHSSSTDMRREWNSSSTSNTTMWSSVSLRHSSQYSYSNSSSRNSCAVRSSWRKPRSESITSPYPAEAGCATVARGRRTRLAPPGMLPALSWS